MFGNATGLTNVNCTAPCAAGYYGSPGAAAVNANCSGPCTAGYYCPAGSASAL